MAPDMLKKSIVIKGMHCVDCEDSVKDIVEKVPSVKVKYATFKGATIEVVFNPEKTTLVDIKKAIKNGGYNT